MRHGKKCEFEENCDLVWLVKGRSPEDLMLKVKGRASQDCRTQRLRLIKGNATA